MVSLLAYGSPRRAALVRYGLACAAGLASVAVSIALLAVADDPIFAPLIAAAALTAWLAGAGPALACISVAWAASVWLLLEPRGASALSDSDGFARWLTNLVVVLAIVGLTELLRSRRARAAHAAEEAEATADEMGLLQDIAARLSSVATTPEIAHVLVTRLPGLIGARGGAVGLIDGDSLIVVDPHGGALETHRPGARLPLATRAPIARAAKGRTIVVRTRGEFQERFPEGAVLTPYAQAAVATPLRVRGEVAGTMSFLYDRPEAVTQRIEAFVEIAADLGGQALERALLYEREVETRLALDRLVRIAPRFHADDPDAVVEAICREARRTFESDYGVLWRLDGSRLELLASDPASDALPGGFEASLADFPALLDAVGNLQTSFVGDVQREARGAGLGLVRRLGIHSSLRVPIAVSGHPERLLSISWRSVVSEPSAPTTLIARRFADQAGLALEQLERRRAEAEARRRGEEARGLYDITAVLAVAATSEEVSEICLQHSLAATSAQAGFVALRKSAETAVRIAATRGLPDPDSEEWESLAERELSRISSARSQRTQVDTERVGHPAKASMWLATHPLEAAGEVSGMLVLLFDSRPELTSDTRRWLEAVVSQCAQALDRARLLDEEKRQRRRADLLRRMTTRLSGAISLDDVAQVAVREAGHASDASGAAVATIQAERELITIVAWEGWAAPAIEPWLEIPLNDRSPAGDAIRGRRAVFLDGPDAVRHSYPDLADSLLGTGHGSFLFVPLVVGWDTRGVLVLSWSESRSLPPDQLSLIETLAAQTAQAVDRALHFEWERTVAETLQRSVLPGSLPEIGGVALAARYLPGTAGLEVGGDWYDAFSLQDGKLGLVVGDVVGKGVAAASTMAQLRNALRAFSLDRLKPSSALARLSRLAYEVLENPFATAVYAVIDPASGICRVASAGHLPPLVAYVDGSVEFVEARGLPLGATPDASYTHEVVDLPAGSVLFLYTDGLVERRDRSIDDGLERLKHALTDAPSGPDALVDHVLDRLVGTQERADDVAILAVQLLPVAPKTLHLRIPPTTVSIRRVRDAVRTWLTGTPLEPADAEEVVLSVWEACVNAVEHGGRGGGTWVALRAEMTDSTVRIVVEDDGEWVARQPDREPGVGLKLMRSLMSSARVARTGKGTKVTLERQIAAR